MKIIHAQNAVENLLRQTKQTFAKKTVNSADGKLKTGSTGTALCLSLDFTTLSTSGHFLFAEELTTDPTPPPNGYPTTVHHTPSSKEWRNKE